MSMFILYCIYIIITDLFLVVKGGTMIVLLVFTVYQYPVCFPSIIFANFVAFDSGGIMVATIWFRYMQI